MNEKLEKFNRWLRGRTVAVVGVGVSNGPLCRMLAERGALVTACDRREKEQLGALGEELSALGIAFQTGEGYLDRLTQELIIKTPGLRFDAPGLLWARERGSIVTSEMELFFALCPCKIIGVTGSDGKSTTTTLIDEMLKAAGVRCHLGGNIGQPLLPRVGEILEEDVVVAELSSFQLQTMRQSPAVAVVTNLAPNHLDMHRDMAEYVDAKRNIFRYQDPSGVLICNRDNAITCGFAEEAKGRALLFSRQGAVDDGAFLKDGRIFKSESGKAVPFMEQSDIRLPGLHNVENYMAALLAVAQLAPREAVLQTARSFAGLQHRLEPVRELEGVRYYNDSIASSPTRTAACFQAFDQKLVLIAGGYDKKIPFGAFGEAVVRHVRYLALIGVTAPKIRRAVEAAEGYGESGLLMEDCKSLEEAVLKAKDHAEAGDIVVLSPACASFDMFPNFEARGNEFKRLVHGL